MENSCFAPVEAIEAVGVDFAASGFVDAVHYVALWNSLRKRVPAYIRPVDSDHSSERRVRQIFIF